MALQYAAHVDHPVSHTSDLASFGLSLVGAAIATVVVVYSGGTALLAFGAAAEAAGTVATVGSIGMTTGHFFDKFLPPSMSEGLVATGIESVRLGPDSKEAAHALNPDSKTKKCHVDMMLEGSDIVMVGPSINPMTRRGDRTKCGGKISDGIHSIVVGGEPTQKGKEVEEQDSARDSFLSAVWDLIGGGTTGVKGGLANAVRGAATASSVFMPSNQGKVVKALATGFPSSALEGIDSANTIQEGIGGAANIIKGSP